MFQSTRRANANIVALTLLSGTALTAQAAEPNAPTLPTHEVVRIDTVHDFCEFLCNLPRTSDLELSNKIRSKMLELANQLAKFDGAEQCSFDPLIAALSNHKMPEHHEQIALDILREYISCRSKEKIFWDTKTSTKIAQSIFIIAQDDKTYSSTKGQLVILLPQIVNPLCFLPQNAEEFLRDITTTGMSIQATMIRNGYDGLLDQARASCLNMATTMVTVKEEKLSEASSLVWRFALLVLCSQFSRTPKGFGLGRDIDTDSQLEACFDKLLLLDPSKKYTLGQDITERLQPEFAAQLSLSVGKDNKQQFC